MHLMASMIEIFSFLRTRKKWLYIVDTAYQTRFRDTSYAIYEYIHAFETQSTRSDYRVFALRNGAVIMWAWGCKITDSILLVLQLHILRVESQYSYKERNMWIVLKYNSTVPYS